MLSYLPVEFEPLAAASERRIDGGVLSLQGKKVEGTDLRFDWYLRCGYRNRVCSEV